SPLCLPPNNLKAGSENKSGRFVASLLNFSRTLVRQSIFLMRVLRLTKAKRYASDSVPSGKKLQRCSPLLIRDAFCVKVCAWSSTEQQMLGNRACSIGS